MNKKTPLGALKSFAFSDAVLRTIPLPASGNVRITDSECKGLALRITSKGTKTFTVRHQRAGKRTLTSIGTFPDMTIHEARVLATELVTGAPAGPSKRTAADLWENVYWPLREAQVRESTAYNTACQYKLRIAPAIGHLPVGEITKRDITTMQDAWRSELKSIAVPNMALVHFMGWLADRDYIPVSPVPRTTIKRTTRERVLTMSELRELWQWAEGFGDGLLADMRVVMQMWLLTGLRRREVLNAEWSEFPSDIRGTSFLLVPTPTRRACLCGASLRIG